MNLYEFLKLVNGVKWTSLHFQMHNDDEGNKETVTSYEELKEFINNNFHFQEVDRDEFSIIKIQFEQ